MRTSRRVTLRLLAVAAMLAAMAGCGSKPAPVSTEDMGMGNPNAKVTLIEYASVSCAHCAAFNRDLMPAIKAKYIDTGKVHYVYREFLTPPQNVSAAGILLARCAGKDNYFKVVDAVMRSQEEMFGSGNTANAIPVLLRIAKSAGMSENDFNHCVTNPAALQALQAKVNRFTKEDGITGTPTFFINGRRLDRHTGGIEEFDHALAPLLEDGK